MAASDNHTNNYTLGRGELYFGRFTNGYTESPVAERYLGNTPELSYTISEQKLDHFNSDRGVKEKDDSISLQVDRTGAFSTDDISVENVALFFFGSSSVVSEPGGAITDDFASVEQGMYYQLGVSDSRPVGARGLNSGADDSNSAGAIVVYDSSDSNSVSTPFVNGTDYTVDAELGRLFIVEGGGIADGTSIHVTATVKASSQDRVISGSTAVEGCLRFIAVNPKGEQIDYFFPHVQISPNGDYTLKGDDWQKIPFNLEILKPSGREAIYANGRPF